MSQVEMTRVRRTRDGIRKAGTVRIDPQQILARAATDDYSVLYLSTGEKILVRERIEEVDRLKVAVEIEREVIKRFKREIRSCKAMGMRVDFAFATLWEEIVARGELSEDEAARVYRELIRWTKRWLK